MTDADYTVQLIQQACIELELDCEIAGQSEHYVVALISGRRVIVETDADFAAVYRILMDEGGPPDTAANSRERRAARMQAIAAAIVATDKEA